MLELTGKYTGEKILVNVDKAQTIKGVKEGTIICFSKDHGDELSIEESYATVKDMLRMSSGVMTLRKMELIKNTPPGLR